ncbi:hypothetical protein Ae406Ps2_1302 [Pseudonocardia sp. Ae406_Ps2]|nr:hypothetical protein Ae406Ps2_1302 [Pseudonocardia sp. Ae406_Ps2]OLM06901.1 hypothetical protein Ae331Ps2_4611c [Pseudonocardia sp. Ae331_Ps2]
MARRRPGPRGTRDPRAIPAADLRVTPTEQEARSPEQLHRIEVRRAAHTRRLPQLLRVG